jgi:hypothetical protein
MGQEGVDCGTTLSARGTSDEEVFGSRHDGDDDGVWWIR